MSCAVCTHAVTEVIDFGYTALAGAFIKPHQFALEKEYRLRLMFCPSCYCLQLGEKVDPAVLFKEYFYFTSATQSGQHHFRRCADSIVNRFQPAKVIEIGCNDGALLRRLADRNVKTVIGVDPAVNVVNTIKDPRVTVINDYFTEDLGLTGADVIVANNVFAHIPDVHGVVRAVRTALTPEGVFVFEVHDLGKMISGLQYDWIYHEHLYYWSLPTLQRLFDQHDMTIFDVEPVALHGGSMRVYAGKTGRHEPMQWGPAHDELKFIGTFFEFEKQVRAHRRHLHDEINRLQAMGKKIAGYGASGRASALIQYCGLDIDYIVDDAPAKQGFYMPGSHTPIYAPSDRPADYILLFAWTYAAEIMAKCKRPMIVPLPEIKTVQ